ncbi:MAG TPA: XRE family transcriptional regulator [Mycobacteriales bacterium]|nr:XRE family transcriptional regulator [Mycobacteriales bacterium]
MSGELRDRVLQVVERSGLRQGEFAALVGMDPTKLSKSLSGVRRFTSLELAVIAERGEVTVDWLLTGQGRQLPAVAARAAVVDEEAVGRATARAQHLEELWSGLREIGAVDAPTPVPARPGHGLMIRQGADLAEQAWRLVRTRGRDPDVSTDLPAVLEDVFEVDVEIDRLGDGLDGLSYQRDGFRLALVTNGVPWTRQRFTLAHELGHLLAGDSQGVWVDRDVMAESTRRDHAEMRANAFAAAFLMPGDLVRARLDGEPPDAHTFAVLMGQLSVSASALAWRLFNLGLVSEEGRRELAGTTLSAAALHGGWLDDLRAQEADHDTSRPCLRLVDAALAAYERGQISVRPLASILNRPVEEVLAVLAPVAPVPAARHDLEEPVFEP